MEMKTELNIIVVINKDIKENLNLSIDDRAITLNVNPYFVFTTLLNKDVILGCINGELNKLLKEHLAELSFKEKEREKAR